MARKYAWYESQPERRTVRLGYASTDGKIGETVHALGRFKSAAALAHFYNTEARRFVDFWSKYGSDEPVGTFYWALD